MRQQRARGRVLRREIDRRGPRDPAEVDDLDAALWSNLKRMAKLMTLRVRGVPLVLEWPGHDAITVHRGTTPVTLTGQPTELTLYLNGRKQPAEVEINGPEEDAEKLEAANLGI